mmetsp:Transcript_88355/g.250368  ORF Transcript_88355/g.250368 Transcript_88355/m.250368 type:complete len:767 (+) Transcript_88355:67-2367(+)
MDSRVEDGTAPLLSKRMRDSFLDEGPPQEYLAFSFMFVFPLPSATTDADEARFQKQFLHGTKTHQSIMDSMVIHRVARSDPKFDIQCDGSLKSMRNATIEIFQTFFQTLFGDDTDSKLVMFTSVENDELFMCLKISDMLMERFADMADYPLQLDIGSLSKLGIKISDLDGVVPAYVRYDAFQKDAGMLRLHEKPESPHEVCVLRRVDRIRLLYDKITDYIDLPELEQMGLVTYFPCHNRATLGVLRRIWGTLSNPKVLCSLSQPIDRVRNYLGEGVAFYFLFVQELSRALLVLMPFAAAARCVLFLYPKHSDGGNLAAILYSMVLMSWFTCFNKHWRRTEAYYQNKWGMDMRPSHTEIHEPLNPGFTGELKPWPIDENELVELPIGAKLAGGRAMSVLGQLLFTAVIIACVSYTQYTAGIADAMGHKSAQKIAALALSLQIQVFSHTWGVLAAALTNQEQHVTMSAWHESMAHKTFLVGFFNTFFSFFYVGFFQRIVDPKAGTSDLLQTNMEIVYGTYVMLGLVDIVKPYLEVRLRVWLEARQLRQRGMSDSSARVSFLENQAKLSKYCGETLAADYMQICFSLAFVVLFSVVMPLLTVLLAFLTLVVQLRADAWKLLNTYKRVYPDMVDGIGMWNRVMRVLEIMCIGVNILLLLTHFDAGRFFAFIPGVGRDLADRPTVTKALMFFVALNLILACKAGFDYLVPDEPERTTLEKQRQALQRARLFEKEAEFREGATMWAKGSAEASAFNEVPPLRPGDAYFVEED